MTAPAVPLVFLLSWWDVWHLLRGRRVRLTSGEWIELDRRRFVARESRRVVKHRDDTLTSTAAPDA